jgi:hypothetical protein
MSLLFTESFIAFAKWAGDDAYTTANTTMRNGYMNALKRAGYYALIAAQDLNYHSGSLIIRADPVYPDRAALVYSSGNTTNNNQGAAHNFGAGIRKPLITQGKPVIGGFSLYVPPEFVPSTYNVSTVPTLYVVGGLASDNTISAAATNTLFIINSDLSVSNFSQVRQSTKVLVPGRLAYIEYRFTDNEVKVWIDDVLVLQSAVSIPTESIGFIYYQNNPAAPATFMQGAAGRWAISNWYNLTEDAQAPNVRLGPTTRVIGVRPNTDVSTNFVRPVDAPSNAAVAGQDLVDAPTWTLQSSTAGDKDVYATTTDTATSSGALIHAVATKVLVSNLESNPHTVRPLIVSAAGAEKEDPRPRSLVSLTSPFGTRNMYSVARRPTDGKVFASGVGNAVFASNAAADANNLQWTQIQDEGGAATAIIGFRSNGVGIVARSDYKFQIIPAGSDIPGAATSFTTTGYIPQCMLVLPDNTTLIGCANGRVYRCLGSADPTVAANWTLLAPFTAGFQTMHYHPTLNRVVASIGASTNAITSDDGGATWTLRATGVATSMSAGIGVSQMAFDGTWFTIVMQNTTTANYIRRSQDGIAWSSPSYNTNGSTQGVISFAFGDPINAIMLFHKAPNAAVTTNDGGANFRRAQSYANEMYGACVLPNGDWFIVGQSGLLMAYTSAQIDTPLVPLAGYTMAYNAATTNPDTGTAWTPAEAAAAKFGMRVTS